MRWLVVSEAGRSELGRKCFERGPARSMAVVADYLGKAMEQGKIRHADAMVAALHLKGLLEAEWIDPFMFQVLEAPGTEALTASVDRAVVVFMAAYGPAADTGSARPERRR